MFKGFIVLGVAFGVGYAKGYIKGQNHTAELEKFIQELRDSQQTQEFFKSFADYLKTAGEAAPEETDGANSNNADEVLEARLTPVIAKNEGE